MLENPLVPPSLLLQSHVKTQSNDMTLDSDLDILPIKKRREHLPLKKRTVHTSVDDKCVANLLHFKDNDESNVKRASGVSEKSCTSDIPMDYSLPNRIRALFKKEQKSHMISDYFTDDEKKSSKDFDQNGIFALNSSLVHFPLPLSFGTSSMALQAAAAAGLFSPGLSSRNLPFPINFPFTFPPSPHLITTNHQTSIPTSHSIKTSPTKSEPIDVCKKQKSKHCFNHIALGTLPNNDQHSELESSSVETYIINPATGNRVRRCYKNMTTERRMEANARERTRVHTIGAAFDGLRKLVPSLAADQKLSKLSILRISCSYIMLLAAMNDLDYSADSQGYTVEECTEMLTETVNSEAKFKR